MLITPRLLNKCYEAWSCIDLAVKLSGHTIRRLLLQLWDPDQSNHHSTHRPAKELKAAFRNVVLSAFIILEKFLELPLILVVSDVSSYMLV